MKKDIHLTAGILATLIIATFFASTIIVELFGKHDAVTNVKSLIVIPGLFILLPTIAATGGTGVALSKSRKGELVQVKRKRMPIIGANGVLVLVPCALFLDRRAAESVFDTTFYVVQGIELVAGAINVLLMILNIRDGLKMSGRFRKKIYR
jgi:hypothetical protein